MINRGLSLPVMPTRIIWHESMLEYNFGLGHPMSPLRLDLTARLAKDLGIFDLPGVSLGEPFVATDQELGMVHGSEYIAGVRRVSEDPRSSEEKFGLGTEDNPAFAGMHDASARLVGGSLAAADAVLSGDVVHAVNFGGGMHHAAAERASGFCIYNDDAAEDLVPCLPHLAHAADGDPLGQFESAAQGDSRRGPHLFNTASMSLLALGEVNC